MTRAATVFTVPPPTYRKALEDGLNEVEDIRNQLERLQRFVSQAMNGSESFSFFRLSPPLSLEIQKGQNIQANASRQNASE
ncbi:hypothetical protein DICVIV_01121 [Dictyocaulus viviparus]|uniref:Uncharacterized protein n=1 Tax=Dictyocaulus viviparus TaxID=29172 RepID=A0A0D8Y7F0_DICVI|nr:hypothetical protein DICVIV_01121 [Dictyocaulus viviparus]